MFGKRASGKAAVVADVDDISVGVAIIETSREGPASILASERMMLPLEERTANQSAAGVLQLLEQCADAVLKEYLASGQQVAQPAAIYVIPRAPWTRLRTAQQEESFPEPRKITKDMIPALAKKALAGITDLDSANILETGIMQVFLNGYPTGEPVGKEARTMHVIAFESDVHPDIRKGVREVFGRLLPGREPVIRSGMRALLTVLHEHIPDIHRYVILNVGGSATSCAVVRKEMVTQNDEVKEGAATIIRRVAGNGLPEETLAQLRMLATDSCSTEACQATKESLARVEPALVKAYGDMFVRLAERRRLPNRAILVAQADLAPWLEAFFSRIDFGQFTATAQPLEVESLTPDHLQHIVAVKTGVRPDTELAIGVACVNILEQMA